MEDRAHSAIRLALPPGPLIWLALALAVNYFFFLFISFPRFGETTLAEWLSPGGFLDLFELILVPACIFFLLRQVNWGVYLLSFYTAMKLGVALFHLLREFVFSPADFARPERIDLPVSSSMITGFYLLVAVLWICLFLWVRGETVRSFFHYSRKKAGIAGKSGWFMALMTIIFYLYLIWTNR